MSIEQGDECAFEPAEDCRGSGPMLYPPGDRRWFDVRWIWCKKHRRNERQDIACGGLPPGAQAELF